MSKLNRVLITGSAGFIGGELLHDFKKAGYEVLGIDNYSAYYSPEMKIAHARANSMFGETKKIDITNKKKIAAVFSDFQPNIVLHMAAQGGVRASRNDPIPYINTNQLGFFNLLELSDKSNVDKFIYASSSSVYGDLESGPFQESRVLNAPKSLYAASKYANELIANYYPGTSNMSRIGLRFFTVYGPWGRPDMAVFRLLASSSLGKEFKLTASLDTMRDFTYVSDVSKFIESLCDSKIKLSPNEIFNVAGGNPYSMRQLFEILEQLGVHLSVNEDVIDVLDVKLTHGSTEKIKKMGLYVPSTDLADGIKLTWNWLSGISSKDLEKWSC